MRPFLGLKLLSNTATASGSEPATRVSSHVTSG